MQPKIVTLRYNILHLTDIDWSLDWRNRSSGPGLDGSNQIVGFGFPRWVGAPAFRLRPSLIGEFQAVRDASQGMANVWRVPMIDPVTMDRERALRTRKKSQPFGLDTGSGPAFAEGVGFQWDPILIAQNGAKKGDTSIVLDGEFLAVGQVVSYQDWPFRITSIRTNAGGEKVCGVAPAVRCDIPEGGIVQAIGHGLFQLEDAGNGRISYGLDRMAAPSLSLVEWINR